MENTLRSIEEQQDYARVASTMLSARIKDLERFREELREFLRPIGGALDENTEQSFDMLINDLQEQVIDINMRFNIFGAE